ncbi:putative family protein [Phaeomoniella chlamydospora]|uniref:Putative family protein n=1 Tax=Phaeomoniella chlamydospora TaxID=158046 RepID=A0A0G2EIY0_PHACM|nr:putative family protein [Phaeomoniella chlamydospora]
MQQRQPQRPRNYRTGSGRPVDPRLTGRFLPPQMPSRTTKVSEKLVLLPETDVLGEGAEKYDFDDDSDAGPPRDDEDIRRQGTERAKSYAERLPKSKRTEKDFARVTAYCTAQALKLTVTAAFIREEHGARTKLYDDCLYVAYHLPLLPGKEGYRLQSSPPIASVTGKTDIDDAIERSEQRDYHGAYFAEDEEQHSVRGTESPADGTESHTPPGEEAYQNGHRTLERRNSDAGHIANAYSFAEMFIFRYGVVVLWNFSERQEKDILADLTFSSTLDPKTHLTSPLALAVGPLPEEDFETEEFHFEYNNEISRPRIYNDMITLRSGDHMIKVAISHAIAQSTKLSFFEESMATQMDNAKDVPRRLALTGELGMNRQQVVKIMGGLFKSRVDVNLCKLSLFSRIQISLLMIFLASNMLDVPDFLWNDEPTLHPLYIAVREYLEIKPRIQVLNERCRVFLDLAEMLSDSIADNKVSRQTWIIIILIAISILVTCSEVFLRFGILSARGGSKAPAMCPIGHVSGEL